LELRSASPVSHDHLAVDYVLVDVERSRHLVGQRLETAQLPLREMKRQWPCSK
jgi:hypothetical protein